MGGNLEGVRAGSLAWFGKEPDRLTDAEAASAAMREPLPTVRRPFPALAPHLADRLRADGTPVPGMDGVEVAAPLLFEVFARLGGTVALPPAPPGVLEVASNAELPEPLRQ